MRNLEEIRKDIDEIDSQMLQLFTRRMELSSEVAELKKLSGKAIFDPEREAEKLDSLTAGIEDEASRVEVRALFTELMKLSKERQERIIR